MSDPSGLKACSSWSAGFDATVFRSKHSGPDEIFSYGKLLPCSFDERPFGECNFKHCEEKCSQKTGTSGETTCKGGFAGLLKCHTPSIGWGTWSEGSGKLSIESQITRKWNDCAPYDKTSICLGGTISFFHSKCVGYSWNASLPYV